MNWQDIREQHPHSWLVVEALDAYNDGANRVIPHMTIIEAFGDDWEAAWALYKRVHNTDKNREYYVLHTDRAELNIGVLDTFGRHAITS